MKLDRIKDVVMESFVDPSDVADLMDVLRDDDIEEIRKLNGDRKSHLMWLVGLILNTDPALRDQAQYLSNQLFCKGPEECKPK